MSFEMLKVPGASRTSAEFRRAFAEMIERHGWDGDAIAAIISRESGFDAGAKNPQPGQTAVGLIQFTTTTLRGLGFSGTRDDFAALDQVEQLPFVERYFERAFPRSSPARPVDYYLATWGARAGLPLEHVLAAKPEKLYEVNAGLDVNGDGEIRVEDLDAALASTIAKARGERLPVGKAGAGEDSSGSASRPSSVGSLPVLRPGEHGDAVELWRALLELARYDVMPTSFSTGGIFAPLFYDAKLEQATRRFQALHNLRVDAIVGTVETWPMMIRTLRQWKVVR